MTDEVGVAGFWSYAHADDAADSGGILELADRLRAEFSLLTGEDLEIFVDRDALAWGDQWRSRIDGALVATTFFIPIVTPRYLKREECRRELRTFVAQAQSLGVGELVLPILYSGDPASIVETSKDEIVAMVARTQYVDWRELRVAGPSDPEYRSAVNRLAQRLVAIAEVVSERQFASEIQAVCRDEDDAEEDVAALADLVNKGIADVLDAVRKDQTLTAQHNGTQAVHGQRMSKLFASRAPVGARFAEEQRFASEELPLAERGLALAQQYLAKVSEMAPSVESVLRLAGQNPEVLLLVEDFSEGIEEIKESMDEFERRRAATPGTPMDVYADRRSHLSRTMKAMGRAWGQSFRLIDEANEVVLGWHWRLHELRAVDPLPMGRTAPGSA